MEEIWKEIDGYPNYMVSNMGRVKSLNYNRTGKEQIMNNIDRGDGRLFVDLGVGNRHKIHRLVAEAFIPNPHNKSDVHHIDHNPKNNRVDNLMWVTEKEHRALHPEITEITTKVKSKRINQFTLDGTFIKEWKSATEIYQILGLQKQNIGKVCMGKRKNCGGYMWKYAS